MRILVAVILVGAVAAFLLVPGKFEQDIIFNGVTYSHSEKKSGGDLVNHFYTRDGKDLASSEDFVQLIEFEKEVNRQSINHYVQPLLNRYRLSLLGDGDENMFGEFEMQGLKFYSLSSPVSVSGGRHYLIYVGILENDQAAPDKYGALDQIGELHKAVSMF